MYRIYNVRIEKLGNLTLDIWEYVTAHIMWIGVRGYRDLTMDIWGYIGNVTMDIWEYIEKISKLWISMEKSE